MNLCSVEPYPGMDGASTDGAQLKVLPAFTAGLQKQVEQTHSYTRNFIIRQKECISS